MRSLVLPLLGWALLLGGVTEALVHQDEPLPSSGVDRTLYYSLSADQSVGLRLGEADGSLVVHALLEVPQPTSSDESQTWLFGVEVSLTVQPGEGEPWNVDPDEPRSGAMDAITTKQTFWLRSRRSLLASGGERIRGTPRGRVVTDSRRLELEIGALTWSGGIGASAWSGGLLQITPILEHPDQTLLLRVERESRAELVEIASHLENPALMKERAARHTSLPWAALATQERMDLAATLFEPLGAEILSGSTRALHRVGPAHATPTTSPLGTRLEPGESTQLTVQGPCRLHVRTQDGSGNDLHIEPEKSIIVGIPDLQYEQEEQDTGATPPTLGALEIPAGALWGLRWTAPVEGTGLRVRFRAEPGSACLWGEPPGRSQQQQLAPETRRFTAWRLDPAAKSLAVPVATGEELGHLVVEAHPRPPENWTAGEEDSPSESAARIEYEIMGEGEVVIAEGAFDAPYQPDSLLHGVEPMERPMGKAVRVKILHPYAAERVRFRTDAPVDLRFLVPMEVERVRSSVYDLPQGWEPSHAPWELAPYVSIPPEGATELVEEHRLVRFDATVVPRRVTPKAAPGAWRTSVLEPLGKNESHLISEPVRRVRRIWQSWERTRLLPEIRLEVPDHGRISIDYRVNPLFAGRPITLTCGETTVVSHLPAAAATVRFDGLPPGEQDCRLSAPLGRYLADVPGEGRRWARRRVYRADGQTLRVRVDVPAGGTSLFVRAYTLSGTEAPSLEARVDEGRPRRVWGLVERDTPAIVRYQPPLRGTEAWLEDRSSGALAPRRALYIPLGDDLAPGIHEVELTVPAGTRPVYVRFDAGSAPEVERGQGVQWEMDGR